MYRDDIRVYRDCIRVYRTSKNAVLGPKYCNINGIWAVKPYKLGPWTLREQESDF